MLKILVTGGAGYIGSHTIVNLIEHGFDVVSIDNLSRGHQELVDAASLIVGKKIKNYKVDLCNLEDIRAVFEENRDIVGIVHFAAFKSVPESVEQPILYYRNNLTSLLNVLQCAKESNVCHFVFSSSCSVYGNASQLPVTEDSPILTAESPYAHTKQLGEDICRNFCKANPNFKAILLRYFNPVGAHDSAMIGELNEKPENLVPVVTQTAIGKRKSMDVFGNDYDTRDGSCIRDYIHVSDVAFAHTLALKKSLDEALDNQVEVFNLGLGEGVTVLELIKAFEKVSKVKLNYKISGRRAGDVVKIYANNQKAKQLLCWSPKYNIESMMQTAWNWEKKLDEIVKSMLN